MSQFIPLLLLHCVYLLRGENADAEGSTVMRGVIMCKRWCERRNWCSEATCNVSIECTGGETPLTELPNTQRLCGKCPEHHVCLRARSGSTKCVKEDTTRESKQGSKSPNQGISEELKHSALQKCRGNIRYVQLLRPSIRRDVVYYALSTNCPLDKNLKFFKRLTKAFTIECFKERKIYYWLMTLKIDRTVTLKRTLSFQAAVANAKDADSYTLRTYMEVFKGITVTVEKENITFSSLKIRSKSRSTGADEFVVIFDKIKGRLFLGTREVCYAMMDDILIRYHVCPLVVYPRGHPPVPNNLLFDSIRSDMNNFTHEDVKNLMHRCEDSF